MRYLGVFILALAVVLLLTFHNVNGDEHNLQMRERRDGSRHHPDIGRNPGAARDREGSSRHSPSNKGHDGNRHGSRDRSRSSGKNKHKSPKHDRKHGRDGAKHGKKHNKHRDGDRNRHH